jgi:hypothetical protein
MGFLLDSNACIRFLNDCNSQILVAKRVTAFLSIMMGVAILRRHATPC